MVIYYLIIKSNQYKQKTFFVLETKQKLNNKREAKESLI